MSKEQDTDALIANLSKESSEVKPFCTLRRTLKWLAFTVVYIGMILAWVGTRDDAMDMLAVPMYSVELVLALATGLLAALAANWLSVPDVKQQKWVVWLPFIPLTILAFLIGYQLVMQPAQEAMQVDGMKCVMNALKIIVVPMLLLCALIKYAATTHSTLASLMAAFSVAALGYIAARLICPADSLLHTLMWHYAPMVGIALGGAVIGTVVLRWRG